MKLVVHKYPLPFTIGPSTHGVPITMQIPHKARFVSLQMQHGIPTLWYAHEPGSLLADRRFVIVMTGESFGDDELGEDWHLLGTFQLANGLVFHVAERVLVFG